MTTGGRAGVAIEVAPSAPVPGAAADGLDVAVLLQVLADVKSGDFSARMPLAWTGVAGKIADTLNDIIAANEALGTDLAKVSRAVGKEGMLSQRISLPGASRGWAESIESVNHLIEDLVRPTSEMQRVVGAVAGGDLSKKITADVRGDMLELKNTINAMVDQLNGFISEVTRVVREVGTEGRLGQAAAVTIEVGGVWKELTDNVNTMARNLTGQVRDIADVTTAVAGGDLSKKITADVKGEFLALKNTVNAMVDQLNRFASEVTRVAREVGVEGKLGGQAQSAEVAGVWKDLTDNVNQLAANLTNQVRAIADVATAVTEGDLTRQVGVEASGEIAVLKDKLNEMIRNLRETTRQNTEQDWLKTNLARFARMLQGQRDLATASSLILTELAPLVSAQHGVFYTLASLNDGGEPALLYQAGYGYKERKNLATHFRLGEGLVGQCAKEKQRILLTNVPGDYVTISSGLGESAPLNIIVLPVLFEGSVRAVVELASFSPFSPTHQAFLEQLTEMIGIVLNTIEANTLTDNLLKQARIQAEELRARQEELRSSNDDLGTHARRLAEQNIEVGRKNREVELAKRLVEEKAEQLAVSSQYKSEFFANMSHELRTPLNSLLILAGELESNSERNLTATQVQYASVIRSSGNDLLRLLNDILDLAKVESGSVTLAITELSLSELRDGIEREFSQVAVKQGLSFAVELAPGLPEAMATDSERLRQVLKNLLANAFKFTDGGSVTLRVSPALSGWTPGHEMLSRAGSVIAFSVADTGIGITADVRQRIFDAFAQADGTTARTYGGTGLGLSISLELVRLLGGEIALTSTVGEGSTFTVYLPSTIAASGPEDLAASVAERSSPRSEPPPAAPIAHPEPMELGSPAPDARREPARPAHPAGANVGGRRALVVDDDLSTIFAITALFNRLHVDVISAPDGEHGVALLEEMADIDIALVDIMMPMMDGYATLRAMRNLPGRGHVPLIAFTARVDPGERERCLNAGASDYIPKPADTPELLSLLGEWLPAERLELERVVANGHVTGGAVTAEAVVLQPSPPNGSAPSRDADASTTGAAPRLDPLRPLTPPTNSEGGTPPNGKILVVDDDIRNNFALTVLLERADMTVASAECGEDGIAVFERTPDIDAVLVDIMMPAMDGYATMRAMRSLPRGGVVPLIAFTAKVDAGERQRCLDAGASDYIPKPADPAELIALLRRWLRAKAPS